jgi:hypothetical protein
MKKYINHNWSLEYEGIFFSKDLSNRHYQQFLEEQKNGEVELIPYVAPTPTWEQIQAQRDSLLKETLWTVSIESKLVNKEEWLNYRQILKNITQTFKTPDSVIWPVKPLIIEEF